MPIYEYECDTCNTQFEKMQKLSDKTVPRCPNGHKTVRRVISSPLVVFKGPGFYVTDNGKSSSKS